MKGPRLAALEAVARQARSLAASADLVRAQGEPVSLEVRQENTPYGTGVYGQAWGEGLQRVWLMAPTLADAMLQVAAQVRELGALAPASVSCSSAGSPLKGTALRTLCREAWYEALQQPLPPPEALAAEILARRAEARVRAKEARAGRRELLALLAGGPQGVAAWNDRHAAARAAEPFRRVDVSYCDLSGARLVDMPEARFADAVLEGADLDRCDLSGASFTRARLAGATLRHADLRGADFTGAVLDGAMALGAQLQGAVFRKASLAGVRFTGSLFDAHTAWPDGFVPPDDLLWAGAGPNPVALARLQAEKARLGRVDLDAFMKRLARSVERERLEKALGMLRKERYQLFAEAGAEQLAGVVKSQTDPHLVYSCLLDAGGAFSCCTQNLNACGGLRGALCKHLLVLVVGLAQAGEVEPDRLDDWVQRSTLRRPELQREALSAVLLRFKGAQAGEVDWRPTETVPEDFYV